MSHPSQFLYLLEEAQSVDNIRDVYPKILTKQDIEKTVLDWMTGLVVDSSSSSLLRGGKHSGYSENRSSMISDEVVDMKSFQSLIACYLRNISGLPQLEDHEEKNTRFAQQNNSGGGSGKN